MSIVSPRATRPCTAPVWWRNGFENPVYCFMLFQSTQDTMLAEAQSDLTLATGKVRRAHDEATTKNDGRL